MHAKPRGRSVALACTGVLTAALALSACGGSSSPSSSGGGTSSSPAAGNAALGPDKKATGDPVLIGSVNDGVSAAIDTSAEGKAADAVVAYANDHLGGIGGRPIKLVHCETKASPTTDCGNQFVSAKVIAVASGSLGQTEPVIKPLNAAGIPMIDILNQSPGFLGSKIDFTISNPLNAFGGPAIYAKKNGLKHAALVIIDVPAAIQPGKTLGPLLFGNAGATSDVVAGPPGAADLTPQIQAEEAKHPDLYHIIGNPSFCAAALKAIKTLGLKTKVTGIDRCLDKTSAASIPGGFKGMTVFTPANLDPSTDEFKLYDAVRTTYANGTPSDAVFSTGYQGILALIRALNAANLTDFTGAGVAAAMTSAPPVAIPLGGGAMFQCNGKQIFISPQICSSGGITADATADGGLENFSTIEDPTIYAPPAKK
ncbi:MAG: putative amino acid transporter [Frankiales bacterium]|nr:putative amino acid transporter [Frankiales bacterium]